MHPLSLGPEQISALYCKMAAMLLPMLLWLSGWILHPYAKEVLWAMMSGAMFALDMALVCHPAVMTALIRALEGTFASLLLAPQVHIYTLFFKLYAKIF